MSAPTPDFLPGSRPPVTPREKAADAVWRFETYDGASLVTSRDCDGVARAALTAALDLDDLTRVVGSLWYLSPADQARGVITHLLAEPETKEAGRG